MSTPTPFPTGTWQIDTSATTITVAAKHLGLFTVPATFAATSGTIEIDDTQQVASVEVVVDASSYASKNAKRNEHIRGEDFLDADTYPTIFFRTDEVASVGGGGTASGTLTVKGQPTEIVVTIADVDVTGANGTFTAAATFDRNAIGVGAMPALVIGKELQLTVDARATRVA